MILSRSNVKVDVWSAGMQARVNREIDAGLMHRLGVGLQSLPADDPLQELVATFRAALREAGRDIEARAAAGRALVEGIQHLNLVEAGERSRRVTHD